MNDPIFSREALGELNTKPKRHSRQWNTNNYVIKSEDGTNEESVRTSQGEHCQLCNRNHDLDECKDFNDMVISERNKFLAKQKLRYGCYESISPKHRACNCPKRGTCKICLGKHPSGLHGFQYKKKDGTTKENSQHQKSSVTSNCANINNIQCESVSTEYVLSMRVVPVKVQHNQSDNEIRTFAILDACSQGTFITQNLMEQLSIKGIPTSVKIKTLIGNQTESSEIVKGLLVLKAASQNEQQKWIRLPAAYKNEIPVESCEIAANGKLQRWNYLERIFEEIGNNQNIKVDRLIGANCLEALEPLEVITSQDKGPYAFRKALGWCVVGPMKSQQLDVISCNRIGVMKAGTQDTAEHHFKIEKRCEDFGATEMLKKMYMIDFN